MSSLVDPRSLIISRQMGEPLAGLVLASRKVLTSQPSRIAPSTNCRRGSGIPKSTRFISSPFRVKMIRRTIDTKACLIPRPQISPTFLARFDFGNDSRFFDRIDDQAASAAPHALTPGASELRLQLFCLASGAPILLGVAFRSGNRAAKMVPAALD